MRFVITAVLLITLYNLYSYKKSTLTLVYKVLHIKCITRIGVTLLMWTIKQVSTTSNIVNDTYLQIHIGSSVRWSWPDP